MKILVVTSEEFLVNSDIFLRNYWRNSEKNPGDTPIKLLEELWRNFEGILGAPKKFQEEI